LKILVLNLCAGFGGAEKSMSSIAQELQTSGDEVCAIVSNVDTELEYKKKGLHTARISSNPAKNNLHHLSHYVREHVEMITDCCAKSLPDVVVNNTPRGLLLIPALAKRFGRGHFVHCCHTMQTSRLLLRANAGSIDRFISVSSFLASKVPGAVFKKTTVIPNGFESASRFTEAPPVGAAKDFLLSLACIPSRWKSLETAVNAVGLLVEHGVQAYLTIAIKRGYNERYYKEIIRLVSRKELAQHITFQEDILDPINFFENHHAVLSTSVSSHGGPETFGRTVVEGWNAHRLVIASACGGTKELVKDGVTGLLFREGSAADLAKAIIEIIGNPARYAQICENGWQVRTDYDIKKVGFDFRKVLLDLG